MSIGRIFHCPYDSDTRHGVVSVFDEMFYFKGKIETTEDGTMVLNGELESMSVEDNSHLPFEGIG